MSPQFGRWSYDGEGLAPRYLEKVQAILTPYGPDGDAYYSEGGVSIVYRPFYTTKESRRETQPHVLQSGAVVTWDGRLDNRRELIALMGGTVSTDSTDSEIVAATYECWGAGCFPKLIGDWALSIWSSVDRSLLLARDPVGTRHLYYSVEQCQVTWSTILDPLVLLAARPLTLEEEYIAGCLSFFPAAHLTPYVGIRSVRPASFVRLRIQGESVHEYWSFEPANGIRYRSDREYEEHFRIVFRESVRRKLRSDRPVLAELSGGMDSSSIVCMADTLIGSGAADTKRLDTVSYYDDSEPNWNERPYFTRVEEQRGRAGLHIDVSLANIPITAIEGDRLRILPTSEDEPSCARKKLNAFLTTRGSRVLLTGFGGDEVLGGVPDPTSELADLLARAKVKTLAQQLKVWALNKRKPWLHLLLDVGRRFLPPALVGVRQHLRPPVWLDPAFVERHRAALTGYERRLRLFGPIPSFQENLATMEALRRQLECEVPPCQPAFEKRYPYLDRDLLEFLFALPREQLLRPGHRRSLMRRALAGVVPEDLLNRKRKAFVARGPLLRIAQQWNVLRYTSHCMITASLRIVDAQSFCAEVERARTGDAVSPVALIRAVGIELWLRNLARWGLLNAERACGVGPPFAADKRFPSSS